jgi:type I restriction enzyme M protein
LANGKNSTDGVTTAATVGYEDRLWQMADALRGSMDASEYNHVCLGLLFLKYISDAFEERQEYLERAVNDPNDEYFLQATTPNRADAVTRLLEDPDEYRAQSIFWVPPEARWAYLKAQSVGLARRL